MTPQQRRKDALSNSRKLCFSCLKPWSFCKKKCLQDSRVGEVIRCSGCAEAGKGKDYPPMSVLYCYNPDHESLKPKPAELFRELKKYLKTMSSSIDEHTIVFSNFAFVSSGLSSNKPPPPTLEGPSKSRPVNPEKGVSVFETCSGQKVDVESPAAHAPSHDACLLLQIVRIGTTQCLLMFDRGANINLIDGEMAEREDLCVLSQEPTRINVAGGSNLSSEYGKYLLTLGSPEFGWHRLTCHGMPEVTVRFPKYDLHAINQEYQQIYGNNCPLPAFTGGDAVSLLIGLQNVLLDPVRIGVLPSGLGVFQSPFKDVFGSNICFGGPHRAFTEANRANRFTTSAVALFLASCKLFSNEIHHNPHLFNPALQPNDDAETEGVSSFKPCVTKAIIPHSKLREISDQDDFSDTISYRCPDCSECQNCKRSSKTQATSMQDAREQLAIERSVELRLESQEVWVDLPFTIDPVKFLTKRHNGSDNYRQALKVYQGQCRKSDNVKQGIRKTHQDLVAQGFIKQLSDLPSDIQQVIQDAPFRHYFPFRSVCKDDSVSTPVRLVVDPTMTGLNLCLPKGENRIAKIFDIVVEGRCHPLLWSTDIGKMYNRLKVKPSSLAYQLMLFDDSLDPNTPPKVWVLVSAWYGVVNTGNQAAAAIEALTGLFKDEFPNAVAPLVRSRYVDDVAPGANSISEREAQINDVKKCPS